MAAVQDDANGGGIKYLNKRIRSSSQVVVLLAAGIVVPMVVEHSNSKKQSSLHLPTELSAFFTLSSGLFLRGILVGEFHEPRPCRRRYVAIKVFVHICALFLVSLSFCLTLMMRMNVVVTSVTVAATAVLIAHRLWQCARTELDDDLDAYHDFDEIIHQLIELASHITSIIFLGWFGMAFFYFVNFPEEARDARFLLSEFFTFITSVAASLTMLKAVPRLRRTFLTLTLAAELEAMTWALVSGVAATAIAIAASKVGGYAALALLPGAVALAAWVLPPRWLPAFLEYGHGGDEPSSSHGFVSVALTVLLAVLTYHAKGGGMSSMYDEAFVLVTAADVVAALGWRMLTQRMAMADGGRGLKAAAKILSFFTVWLLVLSIMAFLGILFGL